MGFRQSQQQRSECDDRTDEQASQEEKGKKEPPFLAWSGNTGSGTVHIAAWKKTVTMQSGQKEKAVFQVKCHRSYHDGKRFQNTDVFWPTDLLTLAHGLQAMWDKLNEA